MERVRRRRILPLVTEMTTNAQTFRDDALDAKRPGTRVLIVDGDRRVRQSLAGLIELDDALTLCGACGDPTEALALLAHGEAELVILDPWLPDPETGLALIERIHGQWPAVRVVAMSCAEELESECLARGASAFVVKGGQPLEFMASVLGGRPH